MGSATYWGPNTLGFPIHLGSQCTGVPNVFHKTHGGPDTLVSPMYWGFQHTVVPNTYGVPNTFVSPLCWGHPPNTLGFPKPWGPQDIGNPMCWGPRCMGAQMHWPPRVLSELATFVAGPCNHPHTFFKHRHARSTIQHVLKSGCTYSSDAQFRQSSHWSWHMLRFRHILGSSGDMFGRMLAIVLIQMLSRPPARRPAIVCRNC